MILHYSCKQNCLFIITQTNYFFWTNFNLENVQQIKLIRGHNIELEKVLFISICW